MARKRTALLSAYTWNPKTGRYRNKRTGQFVGRDEMRVALERAQFNAQADMRTTSRALQSGRITLTEWRDQMATHIKSTHLYSAALPRGGWAQLTAADYGRVGRLVRDQYAYLNRFTMEIAAGYDLGDRFLWRAGTYADASVQMYHESERVQMGQTGKVEERNVLGNAEHCGGCEGETARGWVPIGRLRRIGTRDCKNRCKCRIRYR